MRLSREKFSGILKLLWLYRTPREVLEANV